MMKSTLPRPFACLKQVLVIAPALALMPLPAAAQAPLLNLTCTPEEECHVAPYFHGGGGFVGQALAGSTSGRVVVVCGGMSSEFSYTPGTNGRVAEAITPDACPAGDNGVLLIRGLEDGGWYYMNDTTSSAVAPLVPLTVLSDPARSRAPYDPGGLTVATAPSISINGQTLSDIGTFLKHDPTGRVGLFPHVAATRRSPTCEHALTDGSVPKNECYLNAVYTAQISVDDGGMTSVYENGDTITRKGPGGSDLTLVPGIDAAGNVQTDVMFDEYAGGAPTVTGDNVHQIGAAAGAMSTVDIEPADASGERCEASNPDRGTALPVKWTFAHADIEGDAPIITTDLEVEIMVACPPVASSSHQGVDLVPDSKPSDG